VTITKIMCACLNHHLMRCYQHPSAFSRM